jgi:hypothetical protein
MIRAVAWRAKRVHKILRIDAPCSRHERVEYDVRASPPTPRYATPRPAQWLTGGVALDANDLAIVEPAAPRIQVRPTSGWPKIPGAVKSDLEATMITDDFNFARYRTGQTAGHYESYFLRANHPTQPLAFWVRYTIFSPSLRPRDAIGELWAVVFDAIAGRHVVAKTEAPIDRCTFSGNRFAVRIGDSELAPGVLVGRAGSASNTITWNLRYQGRAPPVFDLPADMTPTFQKRRPW